MSEITKAVYRLRKRCSQCGNNRAYCSECETGEQLDELFAEYDREVKAKVDGTYVPERNRS